MPQGSLRAPERLVESTRIAGLDDVELAGAADAEASANGAVAARQQEPRMTTAMRRTRFNGSGEMRRLRLTVGRRPDRNNKDRIAGTVHVSERSVTADACAEPGHLCPSVAERY